MPQKYAIFACKAPSLNEASFSGNPYPIRVVKKVKATPEQYDDIAGDLLKHRAWLVQINTRTSARVGDKPLVCVVEVTCPGRKTFYIDPEDTAYARTVGVSW